MYSAYCLEVFELGPGRGVHCYVSLRTHFVSGNSSRVRFGTEINAAC